jgi:poly(3-hydroxybutyrate) depolymerase
MEARTVRLASATMHYRLFKPANYTAAKAYPIVVALHGIGEVGTDNRAQVDREDLAHPWIEDSVQAKTPHFIMIPQCPSSSLGWGGPRGTTVTALSEAAQGIVDALDSLRRQFNIDTSRMVIAGLSLGGGGTYHLLQLKPGLFSAAVPCAAGGDSTQASIIGRTPIWHHHGADDGDGGKRMSKAFESRGIKVFRFVSQTALPAPSLGAYRNALAQGASVQSLVARNSNVPYDSLKRAVASGQNHIYSELTGGDHRSGWMIAWHHPLVAEWAFSKVKPSPVHSIAPRSPKRDRIRPRLVFGDASEVYGVGSFTIQGRWLDSPGSERAFARGPQILLPSRGKE